MAALACRALVAVSAVGACLGLLPADARATLGGDTASVAADHQHLMASRQVFARPWGERHDLELPGGIFVHEYVAASGRVFAVRWHGPRVPDLRAILGPYFADFTHRPPGHSHHHARVVGTDVIIESSGHARSFSGRAWVPSLVPASVAIDTVLAEGG